MSRQFSCSETILSYTPCFKIDTRTPCGAHVMKSPGFPTLLDNISHNTSLLSLNNRRNFIQMLLRLTHSFALSASPFYLGIFLNICCCVCSFLTFKFTLGYFCSNPALLSYSFSNCFSWLWLAFS